MGNPTFLFVLIPLWCLFHDWLCWHGPVPAVTHRLQWHLSILPLRLAWVPPAQQGGRKLEKLRNKYITWVCLCPHGGDFAVMRLVSCHVTHWIPSADPGPLSRWEMAVTDGISEADWCSVALWNRTRDVCWWDDWSFLGQASAQFQALPLFGVFLGWHCSISLHFSDLLRQYSCTSRFAAVHGTHVVSGDRLRLWLKETQGFQPFCLPGMCLTEDPLTPFLS